MSGLQNWMTLKIEWSSKLNEPQKLVILKKKLPEKIVKLNFFFTPNIFRPPKMSRRQNWMTLKPINCLTQQNLDPQEFSTPQN